MGSITAILPGKPENRFNCIRKSMHFPVANCAAMVAGGAPWIAPNPVASKPYHALKAEAAIAVKPINEATEEAEGVAAVQDTTPLTAT